MAITGHRYLSFLDDQLKGLINLETDVVKCLLLTDSYTVNATTHTRLNNITGEVSHASYTTGGLTVTTSLTKDTGNNKERITFAETTFDDLTASVKGVLYYIATGTASTSPLILYIDLGAVQSISGLPFVIAEQYLDIS